MSSEQGEGVPVPEEPKKKEGKPVAEMLMNGDFADMWRVIDVMADDIPDNKVWERLLGGAATLKELAYWDGDINLSGEDVANTIRMINAVAGARFPGYKEFEPHLDGGLPSKMTEAQKVGLMGHKLIKFFEAPGIVALCLNSPHSDTEHQSGMYKKQDHE